MKFSNQIRIVVVFMMLISEWFLHYYYAQRYYSPFLIVIYLFLFYWYYTESKNSLKQTDKLILLSFISPIISEWAVLTMTGTWRILVEMTIFGIGHIFIIWAYRNEKSKIISTYLIYPNLKIIIPFAIIPIAFTVLVLVPVLSKLYLFLVIIFLIEIIYLVLLSINLPFSHESRFYISLSSFFFILYTGFYSYCAFLSPFFGNHAIITMSIVLFRTFLVLGMLNRSKVVTTNLKK